jgi:hypothetical protein
LTAFCSTSNRRRVRDDENFHVSFITKPSVQKALGDELDLGLLRVGA